MLTIRLQRSGKKNKPEFRIVLAEKAAAARKKFIEVLGHYNPHSKNLVVKGERLQYWISQHVALSPTVHNLLITQKVIEGTKVQAFRVPKKPAEPEAEAKPEAQTEVTPEAPAQTDEAQSPASADQQENAENKE